MIKINMKIFSCTHNDNNLPQNLKSAKVWSLTFEGGWGIGPTSNPYSDLNKTCQLYKQHLVGMIYEEIKFWTCLQNHQNHNTNFFAL